MTGIALTFTSCAGHRTASPPPKGNVLEMLGAWVVQGQGFTHSQVNRDVRGRHIHRSMQVTTTGLSRFSVPHECGVLSPTDNFGRLNLSMVRVPITLTFGSVRYLAYGSIAS